MCVDIVSMNNKRIINNSQQVWVLIRKFLIEFSITNARDGQSNFIISHSLLFNKKNLYDLKQTVALHIWFALINWYKKMYFHRNSSLHLCRFSLFFILFWIRQICSIQFHLWFFMWFYCGVVYIKLGRTLIIYHTIIIITASVHQQFMPSSLFCHLTNKSF